MKTSKSRRSNTAPAFTLIEILVVISIIVILASLAFAAGQMAIKHARMTAAKADENAIQIALDGYYAEYSKLPLASSASAEIDTTSEAGRQLIAVLLGQEDSSDSMLNPRRVSFLNLREGKNKANGIIHQGSGSGAGSIVGIFDPWGNPYKIVFDTDFSGQIPDPLKSGAVVRNRTSIVYTTGYDKLPGTPDDVKTW
jgi:prepilin-type N-terminal cleavage/methylation domain-containing protein